MKNLSFKNLSALFILLCFAVSGGAKTMEKEVIPSPPHEMRAVWVATVANIDWPSKPGLSVEEQKKEAIVILDKAKELNLNAIVFQVRPQADALYKSEFEPWSYYLTGEQGKAPEPFYDPLEFWIEEAHIRALELHVWFNPYRANHPAMKSDISENSIVKAKPNLVKKLGDKGYYWMDPALKEVQDHSTFVVMDVVNRYDIDGVHFDDYFYPYPEYNDKKDFPDEDSYAAYKSKGGKLKIDDWRREAVNTFIERVYKEIKKSKPHVKYGISPFGIWRPGYPESIAGFDQYAVLYADAKLWLNKGWVDYLTPQLYWQISKVPQSFPVLLSWWAKENTKNRNLWPGQSIGGGSSKEGALEIINQIMVTRGIVSDGPGNIFFSMKSLLRENNELAAELPKVVYTKPALMPASPWIDKKAPETPLLSAEKKDGKLKISVIPKGKEKPFLYVLYILKGGKWSYEILYANFSEIIREDKDNVIQGISVSAVDRNGNESLKASSVKF